uniref:Thioredoxin domain-containing protein n=1 Tax=Hucho hucho TaxID=62062 RepID=A0A4W5Q678_9TELE
LRHHGLPDARLALLVMFHAPWCGHCNKLLPTFGKVATALKAKNMLAGSIDGTNVANRPLMQAFRIASYPTILMLHDTSYTLFEGDRSVDALVAFADGGYKTTTSTKKDMPVIPKAEAIQPQQAKKEDASVSSSELFLFHAHWCDHCKDMMGAMLQTALTLKDHGNVHVARVDADINAKLGMRFAITGYPTLVLIRDGRVYEFDGLRDPKLMTAFALTDYATKDSRPLPQTPMDGKPATKKKASEVDQAALVDVQTLTTDDVRGSKLARLVMFHAPWCGHCNKLLPTFGKVATALKAKNIIAGSIDGTNVANRPLMQAFRVASYPTILMLHDDSPHEGQEKRVKRRNKDDCIRSHSAAMHQYKHLTESTVYSCCTCCLLLGRHGCHGTRPTDANSGSKA